MEYCRSGLHQMTPENVYVQRDGRRQCKPCKNAWARRSRAAKAVDRTPRPTPAPRHCEVGGCDRVHYAKGWCNLHWNRWRKTGSVADPVFVVSICTVAGCDRPSRRNGWCNLHSDRARRNGDPTKVLLVRHDDIARFEAKTNREGPVPSYAPDLGPCWLWTGVKTKDWGYGRFSVGGRFRQAHRWSYEHFIGPIPKGLEIDHLCMVTSCVRPEHLEPVTRLENQRRAATARRRLPRPAIASGSKTAGG